MGDRPPPVAEFTAGKGARDVTRTIFAVGDEKQSIFSFQNAAPKEFALMRRRFQSAHANAGLDFVLRKFEHSFRSGDSVLGAVDEVFKASDIAASVDDRHRRLPAAYRLPEAPPGMVEVWEPEKPDRAPRHRGLGRAVRHRERDEPARQTRAADRAHRARLSSRGSRSAPIAARRAMATCSFWCASAGRCSKRSSARSRTRMSRSPAPTVSCSPSISRSWT